MSEYAIINMLRFQKFKEGMSSDEIEEKLDNVRQVVAVAKDLGKQETVNSLIPFLNDWCPDNDDEALTELAKEVYNLKEVFTADEMKYVLPILKHLATTEEVVVREAAVDSINKIVDDMSPAVVRDELVGVIDGLFHDEWFTPRVSSASLIAKVYTKIASLIPSEDVSQPLQTLRDSYFALCKDDTPMVRRAAAKNMSNVFAACSDEYNTLFVNQFEEYYNADDDATKLALMGFTKELLERVKDENDREKILSIFKHNLEARSFKTREAAALEIGSIAEILGGAVFTEKLLASYIQLLTDNNSEVRKNAIKQLTPLSKYLPTDIFMEKLYPFLPQLANDMNHEITEQIAGVIIDLSSTLSDKVENLFDLILATPTSEIRLLLLRRLDEIKLNESLVKKIVLDESLDGPDWRVREEVAKHMPYLLSATKETDQQARLLEIYLHLFVDNVSRVRETCRSALATVITTLGADFTFENIISKLQQQYAETTNYLIQFNILYTYEIIIRTIPTDERINSMYETLIIEMNNSVPNIRFITCRILSNLNDVLPEDVKSKAITKLQELKNDEDRDVRYFAEMGLKKLTSSA